jgi:hypothetical protein
MGRNYLSGLFRIMIQTICPCVKIEWGQTLKTLVFLIALGSGFVLVMQTGLHFAQEHLFMIKPDPDGTKRITKVFKV